MSRQRAHLLTAAVAAVLVLAACGSDAGSGDEIDPVGGNELRSPEPIELASGGGDAAARTAEAGDIALGRPYRVVGFEVGDAMPALPTDDTGWVFDAGVGVDADAARAIADALDVDGELETIDAQHGGGYRIGPDDGSAAALWISADAQQSWTYSAARAPGIECAAEPGVPVPTDAVGEATVDGVIDEPVGEPATTEPVPDPCGTVEAPEGVPAADEAEDLARGLVADVGGDADALHYDVYADEWFASVDVTAVDDRPDRRWSFGFGPDGRLEYARGTLATAEQVGPYPLIDVDAAVARLESPIGPWGGGSGRIAIDVAAGTAVADAPPVGGSPEPVPDPLPVESLPVEPMPVESIPEPVTVTLVDVESDVWWTWDVDGSVWVLPAYRFVGADGGWYVVPAVTDEYLVRPVVPEPGTTPDSSPPRSAPAAEPTDPPVDGPVLRSDLVGVDPPVAEPGGEIEVTFAEPHPRGIAWSITTADGAVELYWLTASTDGFESRSPRWVPAGSEDWGVEDIGIDGTGPDRLVVPDTIAPGEYRLCTANAGDDVCGVLGIVDPDVPIVTQDPKAQPTESIPPIDEGAVPVVGVDDGVEFSPACGNETLDHDGTTWYQISEYDFPDEYAAVLAVDRDEAPATAEVRGLVRVIEPGPGDDVGTLVVWADGVARFTSDSGDLTAWLIDDELTYDWVC